MQRPILQQVGNHTHHVHGDGYLLNVSALQENAPFKDAPESDERRFLTREQAQRLKNILNSIDIV